MIIKRYS